MISTPAAMANMPPATTLRLPNLSARAAERGATITMTTDTGSMRTAAAEGGVAPHQLEQLAHAEEHAHEGEEHQREGQRRTAEGGQLEEAHVEHGLGHPQLPQHEGG